MNLVFMGTLNTGSRAAEEALHFYLLANVSSVKGAVRREGAGRRVRSFSSDSYRLC